jgi:predicted phosphodiesterase
MRKIAVITDTHANLPALEAALEAIADEDCDTIYHTGDALAIGPYPGEVLDRLLKTPNLHLLMGNHDDLFASGLPQPQPEWMSEEEVIHQRWTHAQIDAGFKAVVAAWPYVLTEVIAGLRMSFLHYPRDASGGFASILDDPTPQALDDLFAGHQADFIFYGHHHPTADHRGHARYVNSGALGCGRDPLARYVVLDVDTGGRPTIYHRAVSYDQSALFQAMEQRDMPIRETIRRMFFA